MAEAPQLIASAASAREAMQQTFTFGGSGNMLNIVGEESVQELHTIYGREARAQRLRTQPVTREDDCS